MVASDALALNQFHSQEFLWTLNNHTVNADV